MICPKCGKETESGEFCDNCGADLWAVNGGYTEVLHEDVPEEEIPAEESAEEAAEAAETPEKKKGGFFFTEPGAEKWPIVISILLAAAALVGILAKIDAIVGVALVRSKFFAIGSRFEFYWSLLIFPIAGAVLFFLKTKRRPILTAIPFAVFGVLVLNSALKNGANFFANLGEGYTAGSYFAMFVHVLMLLCIAGCAAAFVVGMIVKKPGKLPLFAIIYGALALLAIIFTMVLDIRYFVLAIVDKYSARTCVVNVIYNFLTWAPALLIHAGCVLALINKAKADNAEIEEEIPEEPAAETEYAEEE